MTRKKAIFIIPGFRHNPTHTAYKQLVTMLKKQGHMPIPISIPWNKRTISQNTAYFLGEYKKVRAKKKYILGFSFGAMIAFIASTKVRVDGLILCSLSPYFKEDLAKIKRDFRYKDFSTFHCARLAKKIKANQLLMLYGRKETKPLIRRVTRAYAQIKTKRKQLFPIPHTEHNIRDKRYLYTIKQAALTLH